MIKIRRGLDLPISGEPRQEIGDTNSTRTVAILGRDYVGMKPTMEVKVGDKVRLGQLLFTDKKTPGVRYTAPGAGTVAAINRGEQRMLLSVVIDLEGDDAVQFRQFTDQEIESVDGQQIVDTLVESGAWTALRTRPYSKVPDPNQRPRSLFVNAMDTNPLAVDPAIVIAEAGEDFLRGLRALARLPENKLFLCKNSGSLPGVDNAELPANVVVEEFAGRIMDESSFQVVDAFSKMEAVATVKKPSLPGFRRGPFRPRGGRLDARRRQGPRGCLHGNPRMMKSTSRAKLSEVLTAFVNESVASRATKPWMALRTILA